MISVNNDIPPTIICRGETDKVIATVIVNGKKHEVKVNSNGKAQMT